MNFDRKYLVWALGYAVVGMAVGIFMAASHDPAQHSAHAHILLVGFVGSLAYGVIHKLWLGATRSALAKAQFVIHQAGAVVLFAGLLLLYGNVVPGAQLDPILAVASFAVLAGALLMLFMVIRNTAAGTQSA